MPRVPGTFVGTDDATKTGTAKHLPSEASILSGKGTVHRRASIICCNRCQCNCQQAITNEEFQQQGWRLSTLMQGGLADRLTFIQTRRAGGANPVDSRQRRDPGGGNNKCKGSGRVCSVCLRNRKKAVHVGERWGPGSARRSVHPCHRL